MTMNANMFGIDRGRPAATKNRVASEIPAVDENPAVNDNPEAMDEVEKIAAAVLYEGYALWPYRRSAQKNQKRWTFGGVYPRAYSEAAGGDDPWLMQTECLVRGGAPIVRVKIRFLHVVERTVGRWDANGAMELVDELQVGRERYLAWDEAVEREIVINPLNLAAQSNPVHAAITVLEGGEETPIGAPGGDAAGEPVGVVRRHWRSLEGGVEVGSERVQEGLFRLTVRITNTTPWDGQDRQEVLRQTLVSTHTMLRVEDGEFVSLMDPPAGFEESAQACQNIKTWPVLAGAEGQKQLILSSPIILYDYPRVAPESQGDLFDGGEIDQLLFLNVLSLTDDEKEEMRASDPRTREILERCERMGPEDFMRLNGAIREFHTLSGPPGVVSGIGETRVSDGSACAPGAFEAFETLERPAPDEVIIQGRLVRKGTRVRLQPKPGGDILDIALAGKIAIVEAIDEDYEGGIHLSVTIEEDPGRELGQEKVLGHRFFFSPIEVEPLQQSQ
jgi:hypothetical protein